MGPEGSLPRLQEPLQYFPSRAGEIQPILSQFFNIDFSIILQCTYRYSFWLSCEKSVCIYLLMLATCPVNLIVLDMVEEYQVCNFFFNSFISNQNYSDSIS
jgi:hypothetical protein